VTTDPAAVSVFSIVAICREVYPARPRT
jgi:hypothetical protein